MATAKKVAGGFQIDMEQLGRALEPRDWQGLTDSIQSIFGDSSGAGIGRSNNGRIHTIMWKGKGVEIWRRCWQALRDSLDAFGLNLEMSDTEVFKELSGSMKAAYTPEHEPKLPEPEATDDLEAKSDDAAHGVVDLVLQSWTPAVQDCALAALRMANIESELDKARMARAFADARLDGIIRFLEEYKPGTPWRERATKEVLEGGGLFRMDDEG